MNLSEIPDQFVECDFIRGRCEVNHVGLGAIAAADPSLHLGLPRGQVQDLWNSGRMDGEGRQHRGRCQDGGADHEFI